MAFSKNRRLADLVSSAGEVSSFVDASVTHADLHTSMDLTGKTVTVANASTGDNDTTAANTAFVQQEIAALVDSAPGTLNTLNELAAALGDDASFSTTVTNSIATKLPLAGGTMSGAINMGSQNITALGTKIESAGALTIDTVGQLNLDSGNAEIHLRSSGTTFGKFFTSGGDFYIQHPTSDEDIIFRGNDGGSGINALTLDMSDAGAATFAGNVKSPRFILDGTGSATTRYIFTDNTNTGDGRLIIQSGGGSAGYGGAINLYSHSHSSKPGDVVAGLSTGSSGAFRVNTSGVDGGSDVIRVDSDGLKFGSDTATANALDDYEEGNWSPNLIGTTGSAGSYSTGGSPNAHYTKVGRLVTIQCSFYISNKGSYTGKTIVTGLPFTCATSTSAITVHSFPDAGYGTTSGNVLIGGAVGASDDKVHFYDGARLDPRHDYADVGTGYYVNLSGSYMTAT